MLFRSKVAKDLTHPTKGWKLSPMDLESVNRWDDYSEAKDNISDMEIVVSGNDSCVALAEGIAGTEEAFAELMTAKAIEIGMTNTNFSNSSGIDHINNYFS